MLLKIFTYAGTSSLWNFGDCSLKSSSDQQLEKAEKNKHSLLLSEHFSHQFCSAVIQDSATEYDVPIYCICNYNAVFLI